MDSNVGSTASAAGTPPPELLERASIALDRIALGRSARSLIFYGRRGAGKTALLHRIRLNAEKAGYLPVMIETQEDCSLALAISSTMASALRASFSGLSQENSGAGTKLHVDGEGVPMLSDSGDLEMGMTDLFHVVGGWTSTDTGTGKVIC